MTDIRLHLLTDDPYKACLMVFRQGLYGLPAWAAIADSVAAIGVIPDGSRAVGYWFRGTLDSFEMQEAFRFRRQHGELFGMTAEFAAQLDDWRARRDAAEAALLASIHDAAPMQKRVAGGGKWS
ncbi:hypothetical protein [Martelella mediterranea]|uniref:Uncharacterized protein n=1 Tax=Martelella mediterranea TaxID=293089 RepID=A0A4R3NQR4_9HYPH|nr:hypothetical protein [Martelella mediterranea]TCT37272.1 hypothetical protein EDC90_10199 [Martelella mediterranea]